MLSASYKLWFSASAVIIVAFLLIQQRGLDNLVALVDIGRASRCENPAYEVRILSFDPLMIHLENFITPWERKTIIDYRYVRNQSNGRC